MRASVYFDGFNVYNGIKSKAEDDPNWLKYKWLNLEELAKLIIPPNHELTQVYYFTSHIKDKLGYKAKRQKNYLDALSAFSQNRIKTIFGRFQDFDISCKNLGCLTTPLRCSVCGAEYRKPNEKKTDVNLSTYMLTDCFESKTDCVVLVSGDTDYEMPLSAISRLFPRIHINIAYPPKRKNATLTKYCTETSFEIDEAMLRASLLPDPVVSPFSGKKFYCPRSWK